MADHRDLSIASDSIFRLNNHCHLFHNEMFSLPEPHLQRVIWKFIGPLAGDMFVYQIWYYRGKIPRTKTMLPPMKERRIIKARYGDFERTTPQILKAFRKVTLFKDSNHFTHWDWA